MLVVFARQGKPVEDDEHNLLRQKLEAMAREKAQPEYAARRKLKAYQEIADHQISVIWSSMNGYAR